MAGTKMIELALPQKTKKQVSPGDFFRVERVSGTLVLRQIIPTDPSQAWFWTREWLRKEERASNDIKRGRVEGPFHTAKEFMQGLK